MAENCPLWKTGICDFPRGAGSNKCSWPDRDFQRCAVYKMAGVQARGGSMMDQMLAAGVIPPGATVVGGRRVLSDDELGLNKPQRKWWQFWK